jgi:uncharacterized protein
MTTGSHQLAATSASADSDARPYPGPDTGEREAGPASADPDGADRYDPTVPPASPGVYDLGDVTRLEVSFPSDGFQLAGHLYLPPESAGRREGRRAAVVLDGQVPSVKEMTVPVYAIRLARAGYLVLTFDRRGFGGSEGAVRQQINPPENIRDIRNATTWLLSRDDVDPQRLAAVGVCAGGGYILAAGAIDRRYQAVAVIGADYGQRQHLIDDLGHDGWAETMRTLADGRLADLEAGRPLAYPFMAPSSAPAGTALAAADEPYDFYTSRQRQIAPSWRNELTQESVQNMAEFDAIGYAPLVAPTPLLLIHGTVDPILPPRYAQRAYDTAGEPKSIVMIETTNHVQIYDIEPVVGQATSALTEWLADHMPA